MNINEEQNCLNKATFNCETTLLQIAWKTIWSTVHLELLNSEPIRTHSSVFLLVTTCTSAAFAL